MRTTTHIRIEKKTVERLRLLKSLTGASYNDLISNGVEWELMECAVNLGYVPFGGSDESK